MISRGERQWFDERKAMANKPQAHDPELTESVTDYLMESAKGRGFSDYNRWYQAAQDTLDLLSDLRVRCAERAGEPTSRAILELPLIVAKE
jgi:hypothetical protein